jgi:hypothetical protein
MGSMKPKAPSPDIDKIELHPDAWERFEKAVRGAAPLKASLTRAKPAPFRKIKATGKRRSKK